MISLWSIIFSIVTIILALVFPVGLAIWFCRKYKVSVKPVLVGALTFFLVQIIIRIPLLQLLESFYPWGARAAAGGLSLLTYALFLSFTAALFEEGGRFLFFKGLLKKSIDWKNAVAFGIGHGGIEAILLVGINYIANVILMILLYTGNSDKIPIGLSQQLVPATTLLMDTPSHLFLLAGIERVMTMGLHIAFTILVVLGIKKNQFRYILYAFLGHFLVNLPAAYISYLPGGIWTMEAYIAIGAIVSYLWIKKSKELFNGEDLV